MLMVCNFGRGGANAGGRHDGGMTLEEYRTSLSLYAVLASPIIISADLRSVASEHAECLAMLKNEEVIAISQDPLGAAGRLVSQATNVSGEPSSRTAARHNNIVEQVFARELSGGARAVALFNRGEAPRNISVSWSELGLDPAVAYHVRDIWARSDVRRYEGEAHAAGGGGGHQRVGQYRATVQPHAAATIRISPASHAMEQASK
jgi:alpha-galactosidase